MTDLGCVPAQGGRTVIAQTLDLVVHDFSPRAVSFFTVDARGRPRLAAAGAEGRPPGRLRSEVQSWISSLDGIDPLGPALLARIEAPVISLADLGGVEKVLGRPFLLDVYRRLGVVNEARMLIRDGERLVGGVTLWRSLDDPSWDRDHLDLLATLQPLVETAYRAADRGRAHGEGHEALRGMTRRRREVAALLGRGATNREIARALGISEATARSHTRAVMAGLGVASRREVVLRLARA